MDPDSEQEPKEDEEGPVRPEFEVCLHLWSGYDAAYEDLRQTVGDKMAEFTRLVGEAVYIALSRLVVNLGDPAITARLNEAFPQLGATDQAGFLSSLFKMYADDRSAILNHAVDLRLAIEAIGRAEDALKRLKRLAALLRDSHLPPRVRQYLAEVVHTFLFGFDAASIALARSAFEQMAREVLVRKGVFTEARLKREQPTAFTLLQELKRSNLISSSTAKATTLITRGNTIAHRHMYEDRIMEQQSFASITDLVEALQDLAVHLPPSAHADS